jgi:hypothetical protein
VQPIRQWIRRKKIKKYEKLPLLLQYFEKNELYNKYAIVDFNKQLAHFETRHFLNELEMRELSNRIKSIINIK